MAYIGITSASDSEQLSPNYIGFQPTVQRPESAFVVDTFIGNGTQHVFPLSNPKPITSRALLVSVSGYTMVPVDDYNLDQYNNIEFTVAPGSGSPIVVHHLIFPRNEATTAIRKLDDISNGFNGETTRFTLTANGVTANILGANVLFISVNGVIQEPGESYILDGDDIIFSEAPPARSSFYGIDVGTTGIGTPGDATISPIKFLTTNLPSQGQVLSVDSGGNLIWATLNGSTGAVNLNGLSDVRVTSPTFGHVLKFNGTRFVNVQLSYTELGNTPNLATVATSGSYTDLINKAFIPTDASELTDTTRRFFDRNYNSLSNKPVIPAELNELDDISIINPTVYDIIVFDGSKWINDKLTMADLGIVDGTNNQVLTTDGNGNYTFKTISGGVGGGNFSGSYLDLTHKPTFATVATSGLYTDLTNKPALATVATSGSYADLTNTPSLATVATTGKYNDLTAKPLLSTVATSGSYNDLFNKPSFASIALSGRYSDLTGTPTLAAVATTGSYNDLTDKPTLTAGATGAQGPKGDTGATGAQGPKGDTGPAGSVAAANLTGTTLASGVTASSLTSVGTLSSLAVSGVSLLGGYSQVAGYYSELGVKYSGAGTQHGMTLQPTNDNTTAINFLNAAGTNIGSITQTASTVKFVGDGSQLSKVATQTTGSWTVTTGTNTYSITVPASGTYQIWVRGNIPNGIIAYNATATVTNTNVPVVGTQYAWVYNGGGTPIDFTSIPNQFIGTDNTIVRSSVAPSATTNRFDFGINNTSGSSQTVYWGYVTL